jgi:hypothetical protein
LWVCRVFFEVLIRERGCVCFLRGREQRILEKRERKKERRSYKSDVFCFCGLWDSNIFRTVFVDFLGKIIERGLVPCVMDG